MEPAGISEEHRDTYMGHADNTVAGRYLHPLPGQLECDAQLLDEYLTGKGAEVVQMRPTAGQSRASRATSQAGLGRS